MILLSLQQITAMNSDISAICCVSLRSFLFCHRSKKKRLTKWSKRIWRNDFWKWAHCLKTKSGVASSTPKCLKPFTPLFKPLSNRSVLPHMVPALLLHLFLFAVIEILFRQSTSHTLCCFCTTRTKKIRDDNVTATATATAPTSITPLPSPPSLRCLPPSPF